MLNVNELSKTFETEGADRTVGHETDVFYYAQTHSEQVISEIQTDASKGLSESEATNRLKQLGLNTIQKDKGTNLFWEVLEHVKSPLMIILLAATSISYALGETFNASIIFGMVLMSVAIDFYLEHDARNAADRLKKMVQNKVTILRGGVVKDIAPETLTIGDIVLLNAGKIIPADARVLESKDFFINQSSLTGESFPCEKTSDSIVKSDLELTDLHNIVFMGSSVISGTGKVLVVKKGGDTQFGKIAEQLVAADEETDFSHGMKDFGMLILRVTVILVLFIFLINAILGRNLLESFMFSIAIAVGLTPEMLPMIMSVTMAKGSLKMSKKGVIVKKLSAIPNFGSMEVLCTDKTGTLTEDKIHLVKCINTEGADSEEVFGLAFLNSHFQSGIQNPLDEAVLNYKTYDISTYQKIDEIPFDFNRKRLSVIVKQADNAKILICKGAPEEIFKVCKTEGFDLNKIQKIYDDLSQDGFRVLAIATRVIDFDKKIYEKDAENDLILRGFIAFLDPPKQDAAAVVKSLHSIGVEIKIITGDNHLVTQKICRDIGLPVKGIMFGHELQDLADDALSIRAIKTTIFARFSPEQKNRVIHALKTFHHAVGYMGDGINDAPSLKAADIGISVSTATDVAKDAADFILTRKSLSVLHDGILEGRRTFNNTLKYILMCLSSNFGNMFSVAAATFILPFLPMLPIQILINNFLYDTSQITIPYDNVDKENIRRPQRWDMKMIRRYMLVFGLTSSVFDLLTFGLLYVVFQVDVAQLRTGWFMESLATQILVIFIIRTQKVPFYKSKPSKTLVWSMLLCLTIGWLLPYMPFASAIGFEPLEPHILAAIIGLVLLYLVLVEIVKYYFFKKKRGNTEGV
jgi:P-type Mg2+ transporter